MTKAVETTDWTRLREFAAVDINQSFIIGWQAEGETLLVDVDVLLTPEHPFYEKPRPAEKVCIRPAIIEFPFCESITVGGQTSTDIAAKVAALGHGLIEGLRRHDGGSYEINGKFGDIFIAAERPLLRLKGP